MSGKIFVVTGANKGIGYAIVEVLAKTIDGGVVYLTARNEELGKTALKTIEETLGSSQKSKIVFHQLDITDENSVKAFADHLKKTHNGLDVLINNAGFAFPFETKEDPSKRAEITIGINYYGTKLVSSYLIPLIKKDGRVVNVCSQGGILNSLTKEPNLDVHRELIPKDEFDQFMVMYNTFMCDKYSQENIDKLVNVSSEKAIDDFVENFKKTVKDGNSVEKGYPTFEYRVSKAAEIALTMLHHKLYSGKGIKINACCPGYVDTDLNQHTGSLTIYQGADTPVYLAVDPEAPDGKFVYARRNIDWY
ncbi:hypothetical protein FO519_007614 [Halicephalobus sp. NKZ332]|nr:hypothetical protein FO519_007614 [Halicephalobus sp. NKZ332]